MPSAGVKKELLSNTNSTIYLKKICAVTFVLDRMTKNYSIRISTVSTKTIYESAKTCKQLLILEYTKNFWSMYADFCLCNLKRPFTEHFFPDRKCEV
jgi:hypothetical protein